MAKKLKQPIKELEDLAKSSTAQFQKQFNSLIQAIFTGNQDAIDRAEHRLASLIAGSQGLADLIGRRRMLLEIDAMNGKSKSAEQLNFQTPRGEIPIVPQVSFVEAIDDFVSRDPRLASSAEEIRRVYDVEHGFAVLRAQNVPGGEDAQLLLTRKIQDAIVSAERRGESVTSGADAVRRLGGFSRAYSETVFRTNINTAYSAGRLRQATDPEVAPFVAGLVYDAVGDVDTRPNHDALDGFTAAADDPVWNFISPPLGYNCRCTIRVLDKFTAKRRGLLDDSGKIKKSALPSGGGPDEGFTRRQRPDVSIYGNS